MQPRGRPGPHAAQGMWLWRSVSTCNCGRWPPTWSAQGAQQVVAAVEAAQGGAGQAAGQAPRPRFTKVRVGPRATGSHSQGETVELPAPPPPGALPEEPENKGSWSAAPGWVAHYRVKGRQQQQGPPHGGCLRRKGQGH